ncbi:hypothetical protein ACIF6L_34975 [Kitasatospora sp. NPDC086009]|uniref:hypothetical protein n=1 Tax=unclassified Kitasatospora TaxID=2633591 RepID=UPI0037C6E04E
MPDDIAIPDDLIQLELAARAAQRAAEAREKFPAPDQWLERLCWPGDVPAGGLQEGPAHSFWPPELAEQLARLREEAVTAWRRVSDHPAFADARQAGHYPRFLDTLHRRIREAEGPAAGSPAA